MCSALCKVFWLIALLDYLLCIQHINKYAEERSTHILAHTHNQHHYLKVGKQLLCVLLLYSASRACVICQIWVRPKEKNSSDVFLFLTDYKAAHQEDGGTVTCATPLEIYNSFDRCQRQTMFISAVTWQRAELDPFTFSAWHAEMAFVVNWCYVNKLIWSE